MDFKPNWGKDWGVLEKKDTKEFIRLRKKCVWCGKGFSIFERSSKYHVKCLREKRLQEKKDAYLKSKAKLLVDKQ